MTPTELEQALIDSVSAEIKLWVEEMPQLKTGYDYETRFTERMRKVGQLLLQTSVGNEGKNRDKKKMLLHKKQMTPTELEQALMSSVAAEIKLWVEEIPQLKTGYDYETRFTERMRKIGQLLLQTSVGREGKERDKKKLQATLDISE